MNSEPFVYTSNNGITFTSNRCDFRDEVIVSINNQTCKMTLMKAVAEAIGHHAVNIRPHLNGFAGYDCINFIIKDLVTTRQKNRRAAIKEANLMGRI